MSSFYFKVSEKVFINKKTVGIRRYILTFPWKVLKEVSKFIYINKNIYFSCINHISVNRFDGIVSITSYPKRIRTIHITVKSILRQTIAPKKIIIWLFKEEFPGGIESLPKKLKVLFKFNVEVRFVEINLKSHLKYFYAFQDFPDDRIITMDDDIIYYPDTIERLILMHNKYPDTICANSTKVIGINDEKFEPYIKWRIIKSKKIVSSTNFIALGVGGVLYPPSMLDTKRLFNVDVIKTNCLSADDLWLKACSFIKETKITTGGCFTPNPVTIPNSQKIGLRTTNVEKNLNDEQWKNICHYFTITPDSFRK